MIIALKQDNFYMVVVKIQGQNPPKYIQDKIIYEDHQNYNKTVINQLSQQIKKNNGTKVITTEKDLVKLPDSFIDVFEIYIIKINIIIKDDSLIKNKINSLLIN